MDSSIILNNINTVANKIYSSVETQAFNVLDDLLIINEKILKQEPLKNIFVENKENGIILSALCFITFFLIHFTFNKIASMYNGESSDRTSRFVLRMIVFTIAMGSSFYICSQVLQINGMFTNIVSSVGKDMTGQEISFESFRNLLKQMEKKMSTEFISLDGVIKGLISFGTVTLVINFSIRYVTTVFLILISPIAIMLGISNVTYGVFKSWCKILITNLLIQEIVIILLIIPLSFKKIDTNMFKIIMVGTIYLLYRINTLSKELFATFYSKTTKYIGRQE